MINQAKFIISAILLFAISTALYAVYADMEFYKLELISQAAYNLQNSIKYLTTLSSQELLDHIIKLVTGLVSRQTLNAIAISVVSVVFITKAAYHSPLRALGVSVLGLIMYLVHALFVSKFKYLFVYFVSYADCYDNKRHGGIYEKINDYAYKNGICDYTLYGFITYHSEIILFWTLIALVPLTFFMKTGKQLPSYCSLIKYSLYTNKLMSQRQMKCYFILRYLDWFLTSKYIDTLRAELLKSYKTNNLATNILQALARKLPDEITASDEGHLYEAACRKTIKSLVKDCLTSWYYPNPWFREIKKDYFDFGTKRDKNGSSLYKHHGDLRYNSAIEYPVNQNVITFDVTQHMSDTELLDLLYSNRCVYQYLPTPISKWTRNAKVVNNTIIYDQQVAGGDTFTEEKFHLNRMDSNIILRSPWVEMNVCSQHLNVEDHHVFQHSYATAVLPIGLQSPIKRPKFKKLFGLRNKTKTLVMLQTETPEHVIEHRHHIISTTDYDIISRTSSYDRASTTNNSLKQDEDKFDLVGFAVDSEFSDLIKRYGNTAQTYDLSSKFKPKFKKINVEKIKPKIELKETDVRMEQPEPIKDVVSTESIVHLNPAPLEEHPKNVKHDQSGPIFGSEPVSNVNTSFLAFASRYLTKKCPTVKPKQDIITHAAKFIEMIKSRTGELIPRPDLMKTKHKEAVEKTAHKSKSTNLKMKKTPMFPKRETYAGGAKYPRGISNQSPDLVALLTPFAAAIHAAMSSVIEWYMPGKTTFILKMHANTVGIDYSSYESSQTAIFRAVELFAAQLFQKCHQSEYLEYLTLELNTMFEFAFTSKSENKLHAKDKRNKFLLQCLALRLSGSALTTVGNTLVAAFMQFLYFLSIDMTYEEAWSSIRYCYGDDSLIKNGHIEKFKSFCADHGFVVTVEKFKGPAQLSLVGKVVSNGKTSLDACRVINKFMMSYGKYDYVTNMFNKWSGSFNPKLVPDNIFSLIGQEADRRLSLTPKKREINAYSSHLTDTAPNDTFEKAFNGEHSKLMKHFKKLDMSRFSDEKFIILVSETLSPFISTMLPVTKKGIMTTENGITKIKGKFSIDLHEQYDKVNYYNLSCKLINKHFGKPILKYVNWKKYYPVLDQLCKKTNVCLRTTIPKENYSDKFKGFDLKDKEPRPSQKETLKYKSEVKKKYNRKDGKNSRNKKNKKSFYKKKDTIQNGSKGTKQKQQ